MEQVFLFDFASLIDQNFYSQADSSYDNMLVSFHWIMHRLSLVPVQESHYEK